MNGLTKTKTVLKRGSALLVSAVLSASCFVPSAMLSVSAASELSNEARSVIFADTRTDFRDESIYFLMTTRFYNGDESNDAQCWDGTQYNVGDPAWRGDFKGVAEKLDYIKALGFTAIWITPVVENCSGYDYHGYHAINFSKVDPRYESTDYTYQDLINDCHAKGVKVIQDVVFNHTGNFGETNLKPMFEKVGDLSSDSCLKIAANSTLPANYESMTPEQQYQARLALMKEDTLDTDNIYHHQKSLNWDDYTCQTAQIAGDCVDLNTENPVVYNYIVDAYSKYIKMGVDGFRIDTVKHISRLTFNKVFNDAFMKAAHEAGNDNFYMFGEVCTRDRNVWYRGTPPLSAPFYTWKESKDYAWSSTDYAVNLKSTEDNYYDNSSVDAQPTSNNAFLNGNDYHTPDWSQHSGLNVIDFPMHWNFENANSAFGVRGGDQYYNDATWNVTYVDSHDYAPDQAPEDQRFAGSTDTWAENLDLMFTWRGIPCIYYGSEIEFKKGCPIDKGPHIALAESGRAYYGDHLEGSITASDFTVFQASGTVMETLSNPLAQHIIRLNRLRQAIPALRKGQYSTEGVSGDLAFKRRYTDGSVDSFVCVVISGTATFSGIPSGTYVDAVTGDTKTVSGSLTASATKKGDLRCYVLSTSKTSAPGRVIPNGAYLGDGGAATIIGNETPINVVKVTGVTLNNSTLSIMEGETASLKATVKPDNATNKSVKWASSDTSVATVAGGTVTAVGQGTAKITATSTDGTNITATCTVTVKVNPNIVNPTGVTLSDSAITLQKGDTSTLTATVLPSNATNKTVTWSSDNASVASVSSTGIVTAASVGTATITATTSNGKTATCNVTVEGKSVPVISAGVYFEKPSGWGNNINAYIYDSSTDSAVGAQWPGTAMTNIDGSVYSLEYKTTSSTLKIIFNDGSNQIPGSQQPGFDYKDMGYYTLSGWDHKVEPVVNVDVTSVTLNKTSASISKGSTVSLTATVAPSNATNKTITWTSSDTSVATVSNGVVTGVGAGTATITAKSNNGKTATAKITVTANSTLTLTASLSATSVAVGGSVTAKASASGGTSPYKYAFFYKKSTDSSWTTAQAYSTTSSVAIKPAKEATYNVCIKVKDNTGTEVKKYIDFTSTSAKELSMTGTLSATSVNVGSSVTAKATAAGGTSPYKYAFFYKKSTDSQWVTAKDYSTTSSVAIKPAKAATYNVCIKVKDAKNTVVKKYINFTSVAALSMTGTLSATSVNVGGSVTAKATATGGTSPYKYAFFYKKSTDSQWVTAKDYSTTSSVAIKPAKAATYNVCIKVKDAKNTVVKKYIDFTSKAASLVNNSSVSATNITLGNSVTVKVAASGGTGSYQYAYFYKKSYDSEWTKKSGYTSTTSVSIKPAKAATYNFVVWAKDSSGKVVKKYMDVTVTESTSASTLKNTSTLSAASITTGSAVTVKCAASGGTGSSYFYQIRYMRAGTSSYTTARSYSSTATYSLKLTTAGTYTIAVDAQDLAGNIVTKYLTLTVK